MDVTQLTGETGKGVGSGIPHQFEKMEEHRGAGLQDVPFQGAP